MSEENEHVEETAPGENEASAPIGTANAEEPAADAVEVSPMAAAPLTEPADGITGVSEEMNLNMIMDIPVDVHVEIGRTSLPVREFLRLGIGSVIQLDRLVGETADLIINGKMIGRGDVVVVDDTFGIRITDLVAEKELLGSA